ncbi:hypothetical protein ES703_105343 [subsurface metagenome]
MELATPHRKEEIVYNRIPIKKIFFLPYISAILPKGSSNIAAVKRYTVGIQLSITISVWNSEPITGIARFMELPMNGVRNDAKVIAINAYLFSVLFIFY